MKVDILAIGVHPDDIELSCSGTLLRHIDMGKQVALLDLTRRELGSRGTPEIRIAEAEKARQLMGAVARVNAGFADGFFTHNDENLRTIIRVVRKFRPEIILMNAVQDRHPDHARAANLTKEACYLSGLRKIETSDENGKAQEHWRPKAMYHYIQDYHLDADFVVEISEYMDKKIELIQTFESQFFSEGMTGPQTPISSKGFLDYQKQRCAVYGRQAGFDYAEGFNVIRNLGVKDLFHLS
ncbi:MAG: bacillithiol biosynthesis deacetylase BshB1 [Saprospiraceae bacterium]|nr:bacillithiol biosynthesis deacetylase BshB1 [Saprospiraceae bacterium]